MNKLKRVLGFPFLLWACSNGGDSTEEPVLQDPVAVQLMFPLNNSECTEGIDQDNGSFLVEFRWNDSENDSYELVVENLATNSTESHTSNSNTKAVSLSKNTPYQWYVISKNIGVPKEAESPQWRFYTAGDGVVNYAPFPADLLSPANDTILNPNLQSVKLEWKTADIDDNNLTYTVWADSSNPPENVVANALVEPEFDLVLAPGDEIYWRVEAHDEGGNSSLSKVRKITMDGGSGIVSFAINAEDSTHSAEISPEENTIRISLGNFAYEKLRPQIQLKPGYTISPESDFPMNFHDDLFYTVTDSNGNEKVYNVIAESGQHEIESFEIVNGTETYIGKINREAATVHIEMGNLDYSQVSPLIKVSPKAGFEESEIANMDLTEPFDFTVISEKGTTKKYTIIAEIGMTILHSYFRNPGFEFLEGNENTGYRVFAGSTQYIYAQNLQDVSQVSLKLVDTNNQEFPLPIFRNSYFHQHTFQSSNSQNFLTTVIPDDLPSGLYSLAISEAQRSKSYPHQFEVINDDRVVRITEINKTDFTRGDTLILRGINLRKEFLVQSNGEYHVFNENVFDLELNQDRTEIRLPLTNNSYNRLKSWTGNNEKPLAIQTNIEGYDHKLNSNIVYFNVN